MQNRHAHPRGSVPHPTVIMQNCARLHVQPCAIPHRDHAEVHGCPGNPPAWCRLLRILQSRCPTGTIAPPWLMPTGHQAAVERHESASGDAGGTRLASSPGRRSMTTQQAHPRALINRTAAPAAAIALGVALADPSDNSDRLLGQRLRAAVQLGLTAARAAGGLEHRLELRPAGGEPARGERQDPGRCALLHQHDSATGHLSLGRADRHARLVPAGSLAALAKRRRCHHESAEDDRFCRGFGRRTHL